MGEKRSEVRILIADDHPVFRFGLRTLLESEPGYKVIGEAVDGTEVTKLVNSLKPAILLLDLAMPRLTGIDALRELDSANTPVKTIVLAAVIEKVQVVEALQLGARGILYKEAAPQLVTKCIDAVMAGEYWVGQETVIDLVSYLRGLKPGIENKASQRVNEFTRREREIISEIMTGSPNKEIASKLMVSEDTVKHHLSNIFTKAGVSNRLELAVWSMNQGFLD